MKKHDWFDIHLDEDGEELHAKMCMEIIQNFEFSDEEMNQVEKGFIKACSDTELFMKKLYIKIKKGQ